jgi:sec-independent protein translocase protein TatA
MHGFGLPELLITLLIVLLLFGPGRLAKAMGKLGKELGAFRNGVTDEMKESSAPDTKSVEEK